MKFHRPSRLFTKNVYCCRKICDFAVGFGSASRRGSEKTRYMDKDFRANSLAEVAGKMLFALPAELSPDSAHGFMPAPRRYLPVCPGPRKSESLISPGIKLSCGGACLRLPKSILIIVVTIFQLLLRTTAVGQCHAAGKRKVFKHKPHCFDQTDNAFNLMNIKWHEKFRNLELFATRSKPGGLCSIYKR